MSLRWARLSARLLLEAYEDCWNLRYPKMQKMIFDITQAGGRKGVMRRCSEWIRGADHEENGGVDWA